MYLDTKVFLASSNKGKILEYRALLAPFSVDILGLDDIGEVFEIEETGESFVANALIKAEAVAERTGCIALADDSGLEVFSLNNAPGIYSARFSQREGGECSDQANMDLLLQKMKDFKGEQRAARFVCAIALVAPKKYNIEPFIVQGSWSGFIAESKKGEKGFGYDPIFFDPYLQKHAAELTREEKNSVSHRGKAVEELKKAWVDFFSLWKNSVTSS